MAAFKKPINVLRFVEFEYPPRSWLAVHSHPHFFQIIQVISGSALFFLENATFQVTAGTCIVLPPYSMHGLKPGSKGMLSLDVKFTIEDKVLACIARSVRGIQTDDDRMLAAILTKIKDEAAVNKRHYKELCALYLHELLLLLSRKNEPEAASPGSFQTLPTDNPVCRRVLGAIHERFAEDLSLDTIARLVSYEKSHICKEFKKHLGRSLMGYLFEYRVQQAQRLLMTSEKSITEIAYLVGFKTPAHFSRIFTQMTGLAPLQWKKQNKGLVRRQLVVNPYPRNKPVEIRSTIDPFN
jgi:AraC-like DNA-binding protein